MSAESEKVQSRLTASDGGSVPVPDPTLLTTQQLTTSNAALKELIFTRLDGMDEAMRLFTVTLKELYDGRIAEINKTVVSLRSILETRLDGMDKAIELLQDTANKFPARIDEKIDSLGRVHEEKFRSIAVQFAERDIRTEQTSRDSKVAVDAALQAAKEAVGEQNRSSALAIAKSETATAKQIDQQGLLIQTATKAIDDKIDDIKERITRIEGTGEGVASSANSRLGSSNYAVGIVGLVIGSIIGIAGIVIAIVLRH